MPPSHSFRIVWAAFILGALAAAAASAQPRHSADYQPPEGVITLSELLRVIQLYNSGGHRCDPAGEDGYAPGPGATDCRPHDADYNPTDWRIALSELLRVIQFYNAGGVYPECGTEDGFAPGVGEPCFEPEGEGAPEGDVEGAEEGEPGGEGEGSSEGAAEGEGEGVGEGEPEGGGEGADEGEGVGEGEGTGEGEPEGEGEGVGEGEPEGEGEGVGEGEPEGEGEGLGEGEPEGEGEGTGEGEPEGEGEGGGEGEPEGEGEVGTVCVNGFVADPGFEAGDLTLFWGEDATGPLSMMLEMITSDVIDPFEGEYALRFIDRFTDDVHGVGQSVTLEAGRYALQFQALRENDEVAGSLFLSLGDDFVVLDPAAVGGVLEYQPVSVEFDVPEAGSFLLSLMNPSLGGGRLVIDNVCLVPLGPVGEGEPEGEGQAEGEGEGEGAGEGEGEGGTEGEGEAEGEPEGEEPVVYAIGVRTLTFVDESRGRSIETRIHYPAESAGQNTPLVGTPGLRFPVVVIAHGFQIGINSYNFLVNALVPAGYIVALPNTETGLFPNHGNFGRDLAFVADTLLAQDAAPESPFAGKVAQRAAVTGHSMGGGATILSAQHSANIRTIAPLAAAETNPSAITAAGGLSLPALVIAGSLDCVTPPNSNQLPMFNALQSGCKRYVSLTGGSHCQFAQNAGLCDFGEGFSCPGRTYIPEARQHQLTVGLLLPWFDFHLRDNPAGLAAFDAFLAAEAEALSTQGACGGDN